MKTIFALLLLSAAAQAAITIRVTNDAGNVAVANIAASNRVANVTEFINDRTPGTNAPAAKLAALFEETIRAWAAEAKRNKVRAQREQETAAAMEAIKE